MKIIQRCRRRNLNNNRIDRNNYLNNTSSNQETMKIKFHNIVMILQILMMMIIKDNNSDEDKY